MLLNHGSSDNVFFLRMTYFLRKLSFLLSLVWASSVAAQTLSITIDPINQVSIGGAFRVAGRVSHDPNTPPIPQGTPVFINIKIVDPGGNDVMVRTVQPDRGGLNGGDIPFNWPITMPWTEDDPPTWTPTA
jgi:hypothetical protein